MNLKLKAFSLAFVVLALIITSFGPAATAGASPIPNLSNGSGNAESDIQTIHISGLLTRNRGTQITPGTSGVLAIMVGICDGGVLANTSATLLVPVAGATATIAGGLAAIPCIPSGGALTGGSDGLATGVNSAILVFSGPGARFIRTVRMYVDAPVLPPVGPYKGGGNGRLFEPAELIQQVTARFNTGTGEAIAQFGRTQEQILSARNGAPVVAFGVNGQTRPELLYFTVDIGQDATSGRVNVALGVGAGDDTAQGAGGICARFLLLGINCGSNFMKSGPEMNSFEIVGGAAPGGGTPPPAPPGGGLSLSLHAGWNMISSPVGSVPLSSLQGNCSVTGGPWWWSGSSYQQAGTIEPAKGYWVQVAGACTMQASGSNAPQSLSVVGGWNLISSSGSWNQMNTGGCTLLSGPWWYDGTRYQQVASGTSMEDFKGYWVKVGGGCSVSSQSAQGQDKGAAWVPELNPIPRLPVENASPLQPQPPAPPGGLSPTLKLHVGWNMISSPIRSVPLSAVQGDCLFSSGPWWWTGTRYEQASTLESAKGYWVKVGVPCTLQTPPSSGSFPQSLALSPGWNLISSSGSWNQLNTGGCTLLSGPWWWNGKQYKQIAPGTPLNGFKGYWAKVSQGCNVNSQGLSGKGAAPASEFSSIAQQAVPLRLEGVRLSQVGSGLELQVLGRGIGHSELRLYDLAGTLVAQARGRGNRLHLATLGRQGRPLANGVYLYIVTVKGADGQATSSEVRKLLLLR